MPGEGLRPPVAGAELSVRTSNTNRRSLR